MTPDTPAWTPFEDGSSLSLPGVQDAAGRVVALVVAPGADGEGWAPEVALGLVRGWVDQGLRVVLADARAERPTLHTALGLKNLEGLTDALLWGASVQHVARPLPDRGFYVVTAGTPIPDGAAPLRSQRWQQLCAGFREAGVSIVALLGGGQPGTEEVLDTATDLVILATPEEDVVTLVEGAASKVRGVLGRESAPRPVGAAATSAAPEDATPAMVTAEPADQPDEEEGPGDVVEEPGPTEAPAGAVATAPSKPAAASPGPKRVKDRGGRRYTLLMVLLAIVAIVILAWLGVLPGFGREDAPAGAVSSVPPSAPAATTDAPEEASPLLAYSLALAAHRDPTVARGRVEALSRLVPGVLFSLAPAEVDGAVFYRVLAGPAVDSAGAMGLAERVARATGMDSSGWVVRRTPRAFQLGEVEDLAAATERAQALQALDVPAYVLAVDYSDGSTRFRVYAGAYDNEPEAAFLSGVLGEHSLSFAPLSHRIGRMPE